MVLRFQKRRWSIVCKARKRIVCLMVRMLQRKIMQDYKGCRRCVFGGCLWFSVELPLSDIWAAKVIFEQRSEGKWRNNEVLTTTTQLCLSPLRLGCITQIPCPHMEENLRPSHHRLFPQRPEERGFKWFIIVNCIIFI